MEEGIAKNLPDYYRYLEDIRQRVRALAFLFIFFFLSGLLFSGQILKYIIEAFSLSNAEIVTSSPFQLFDLAMSVGMYTALILCSPFLVYHFYSFLKDGLSGAEKKFFFVLLPVSLMLYLFGFLYGFGIFFMTLDSIAALNISLGIRNVWDINKFLLQIIWTASLLGVLFQYPIVLTFLAKVGLLTTKFLREKRRHAIAVMFVLTALLPPTDGLSLIIMVVPLIVIYEVTILISVRIDRRKIVPLPVPLEV